MNHHHFRYLVSSSQLNWLQVYGNEYFKAINFTLIPQFLNSPGTVPGYGGAAPPAPAPESISVVIEWITQPPLMDTYRAECTGNRWLNVARWFPLTAIFHWFTSANTSKSNCWPYAIGQPPQRSSAPQTWFWSVFRTITDSFGRMLRWNTTSSRGFRAAPVWMFIWHLCGERNGTERSAL